MSEYTLVKDITSYEYPSHMKRPEGFFGSNFFEKWIPDWKKHLGHLKGKENVVGIEIGCLNGDCSVFCAQQIADGSGSLHTCVDINETEFLKNNIAPYIDKNIRFVKATSYDALRWNFTEKSADYIYIDGSHLAIDVLSDAVLAWSLLKDGGILIFDDYGWGIHTTDEKQKPKLAIDAFMQAYVGHYELIHAGWQVFLKKLPYTYSEEELSANYQK
jgi:predicted O-methyltransferase YrrM